MKYIRGIVLMVLVVLATGTSCMRQGPEEDRIPSDVLPDALRVKFSQEPSSLDEIRSLFPDVEILNAERTFPECGRFEERTRREGLHLWYELSLGSAVASAGQAGPATKAEQILQNPAVEHVEYVRRALPTALGCPFNDPMFNYCWSYSNTGSLTPSAIAGMDINLLEAWELETGKEDVIVAVIDSGIRTAHEDLAGAMWVNELERNGVEGVDDDGNGYVDDIYGFNFCVASNGLDMEGEIVPADHGTHVAGTIAAVNNNGLGTCGIAGGDGAHRGVRIMNCQIIQDKKAAYISRAIKYAADNGAVIANNSWTSGILDESVKNAIDYFVKYAGMDESGAQSGPMAGGLMVFAAGNDAKDEAYPAMYESVLSVAATGPSGKLASYSNYGEWVDISAPGGDNKLDKSEYGAIFSTIESSESGYGWMQGTSMAAPHVSGVAALVVSHYSGLGFSCEDLWNRIIDGADKKRLYDNNPTMAGKLGAGMLDAFMSLSAGGNEPPEKVADLSGEALANEIVLSWTVPRDPDSGHAALFRIIYSKSSLASVNSSTFLPSGVEICEVASGNRRAGDSIAKAFTGLEYGMDYHFRIEAIDADGNSSGFSPQIVVRTMSNTPPEIVAIDGSSLALKAHETKSLNFEVSDADGQKVSVSLKRQQEGFTLLGSGAGKVTLTVNALKTGPGSYENALLADDGVDVSEFPFVVEIDENHAPVVLKDLGPLLFNATRSQSVFDLREFFADPDGEELTFYGTMSTWSSIVSANFSEAQLTIASVQYGTTVLSLYARDSFGLQVSQQVDIVVRDGSQLVDAYPNPVSDILNVSGGKEGEIEIHIYDSLGSCVYSSKQNCSVFAPATVDMSGFAPGVYKLSVHFDGKSQTKNIVKI